jgi:hypothetical protein
MPSNVDITQFGQLGAFVVIVMLFLKHEQAENQRRDEAHNKLTTAIDKLSDNSTKQIQSIDRNTIATDKLVRSSEVTASASKETLQFMKNLNGSLRKAVQDHKE